MRSGEIYAIPLLKPCPDLSKAVQLCQKLSSLIYLNCPVLNLSKLVFFDFSRWTISSKMYRIQLSPSCRLWLMLTHPSWPPTPPWQACCTPASRCECCPRRGRRSWWSGSTLLMAVRMVTIESRTFCRIQLSKLIKICQNLSKFIQACQNLCGLINL